MNIQVSTATGIRGTYRVPGDKSISHRALILAGISRGRSRIHGFLAATDCMATVECMRALGTEIEQVSDTELIVQGRGLDKNREPEDILDCGGSGTTARLLAGLLAGRPFFSVLTGNAQLRRRPMMRVVAPLRMMGARITGRDEGRLLPLCIEGGQTEGMDYRMPVASAQVKSAILLAGLSATSDTTVREPGPTRDHTERMLYARGVRVRSDGPGTVRISPRSELEPVDQQVPGDQSSAAFLVVAACLVPGSEIRVMDVGVNPTRTGLLDVLREMGADLRLENEREAGGEPIADIVVRHSQLKAAQVSGATIPRLIDELPVLALAATQAHGVTIIRDADELRVKETDRIATTVEELRKLGARIEARQDGFEIEGPIQLRGTAVDSHSDHRLAMMLAVAGLAAQGETAVGNSDCIVDSFPGFEGVLHQMVAPN